MSSENSEEMLRRYIINGCRYRAFKNNVEI